MALYFFARNLFIQIQKRPPGKLQSIRMFVKVEKKKLKNIVLNLVYRPLNGDQKELENYFKSSLSKREISHKDIILAGDLNINLLDFDANKKTQNFVNLMFRFGMIPTKNKPTRVTRQTACAIDYIITNSIMHTGFISETIKTDISDHFPIFFVISILLKRKMLRKNLYINADSPISQ